MKGRDLGWWCRQVWRLPEIKLDETGNLALLMDPSVLTNNYDGKYVGPHHVFYAGIEKMAANEDIKNDAQIVMYLISTRLTSALLDNPPKTVEDIYKYFYPVVNFVANGEINVKDVPEHFMSVLKDILEDVSDIAERLIIRTEPTKMHDKKIAEVRIIIPEAFFIFVNFVMLAILLEIVYAFYVTNISMTPSYSLKIAILDRHYRYLVNIFRLQTQEQLMEAHVQLMFSIGDYLEKCVKQISL